MAEGLWEQLDEDRRERVLAAMAAAMAELGTGPWGLDRRELAARAGVPERHLRGLLEDADAALEAVLELALGRLGPLLTAAYDAESRWLDRIRAGVLGLLDFIVAEPELGALLATYATGGAERSLRRRRGLLAGVEVAIDAGRFEPQAQRQHPLPIAPTVALGAAAAVMREGLLARQQPAELFGPIVSAIVLPYLGAAAARRELSRPAPRPRIVPSGEPTWEGPGARLPYRTRRALEAIHAYPGASNREVAERAGIVDQGQASKLLARLQARGLVEKAGGRRARGAPNSWRLTERGERALAG